jgi:hypothetical protein
VQIASVSETICTVLQDDRSAGTRIGERPVRAVRAR